MSIKGLTKIAYFSKGKRGIIYTALYKGKKVAIKAKHPESKAVDRIRNEHHYLKLLNKKGIGPKAVFFKSNTLVYEFVEGEFLVDWIQHSTKKDIIEILKNIFLQLYQIDKFGINKEEMHHPVKHILVNKDGKPVLIDFERAYQTKKPHNVTQFCQFLTAGNTQQMLKKRHVPIQKAKLRKYAQWYKKQRTRKAFVSIMKTISLNKRAKPSCVC